MLTKPTSAYVHIPFCTQICYYCDFSKVFIKNQPVDEYLQALIREFESYEIDKGERFVFYILRPRFFFLLASWRSLR